MKIRVIYAVFLMLVCGGCHSPKNSLQPIVYRWPVMGTFYEVNWVTSEINQGDLSWSMFEKIRWVDEKVSTYKSSSDISKLNENAGGFPLRVDSTTTELLEKSIYYNSKTNGLFDIATGALVKLWKLNLPVHGEQKEIPLQTKVKSVLNLVRKTKIDMHDQNVLITPKGAYLDMGAIAKGYALDVAYELSQNATCGFMNLGRQMMMVGKCQNPLRLGIQSPFDESKILATVELLSGSISTSGSYERYFLHNGRTYTHIINPKTGYPVDTNLVSVTVWAKSAMEADVWSTALFVAGLEEGQRMIEREKTNLGVLWILKDQKMIYIDSVYGRVILENQGTTNH